MTVFRDIKNALLGGEISPAAFGRTDLPQYRYACKTLKNMIPRLSGGAYQRPGTLFANRSVEELFSYPRLIPFVVSQEEAYCLAFYRNFNPSSPGEEGVYRAFRATDSFTQPEDAVVNGFHPYRTANEANADYDEVDDLQWAQSVDVMTLVHPLHKPRLLVRDAIDNFTIKEFDAGLTGATRRDAWPYRPQNTTAITLTPSVTTGNGTLTASTAFFDAGHVGAVFKINHSGTYGAAIVTGYVSSTVVNITVIVDFGATTAQATWWESAWSDYRGWPRSVGYFQQRRVFGGNATDRDSLWFSESSDYTQLSHDSIVDPRSSPTGSQAFTLELSSPELNLIQWISADLTLAVGTMGQVFIIEREVETSGFGADNCKANGRGRFGSAYHPAQRVGDELIFSPLAKSHLQSIIFNLIQNAFNREFLQVIAGHFPKAEKQFQRRRYRVFQWDETRSTMWCVDTAGNWFGITRDRALSVSALHSHQLGGYDADEFGTDSGDLQDERVEALCSGSVMSLAVVPSPTLGINDVWLSVKRKLNGVWVYTIERMQGEGMVAETIEIGGALWLPGAYYVDSAVAGLNQTAAGGGSENYEIVPFEANAFNHLLGVACKGTANKTDGRGIFSLRELTPEDDGGGNTIAPLTSPYPSGYDSEGYALSIGLPFAPVIEPVMVDAGSQIGTAQAAIKYIHELTIRFFKTIAAKVGRDKDNLETIIFTTGSTPMNESAELYTGNKKIDFGSDREESDDSEIYITNTEQVPFEVSSIVARGETADA